MFLLLRMVVQDVFHPLVGGDVGVDFGSEDAFVTKHLLHHAQVRTALYQMGSKGVAEGMRRDIFLYPDRFCLFFYHCKDHYTAQTASSAVEKEGAV